MFVVEMGHTHTYTLYKKCVFVLLQLTSFAVMQDLGGYLLHIYKNEIKVCVIIVVDR